MFQKLKEKFMKELVLAAPNLDKKMQIGANVLDYTTRRVLSMECKNKRWRFIAFFFKISK